MAVVKMLVDAGGFEWRRTTGDHAQLYYEHPTNEEDRRQVRVPLHDELRTGTLRSGERCGPSRVDVPNRGGGVESTARTTTI